MYCVLWMVDLNVVFERLIPIHSQLHASFTEQADVAHAITQRQFVAGHGRIPPHRPRIRCAQGIAHIALVGSSHLPLNTAIYAIDISSIRALNNKSKLSIVTGITDQKIITRLHFISPPERRQYVNESTVDFGDSAAPQGSHAPLFLADGAWMEPASFRFCDTRGSGSITISGVAEPRQLLIGAMQIAIETQAGQYQDVLRALDGQQMTDVRLTILYRETSPHARKIARQFMNNNDLDLADYLAQKGEGNLAAHRLVRTALILHYGGIDYSELDNKDQGPIQARLRAAGYKPLYGCVKRVSSCGK
jgi:hypothetical protein